MFPVIVDSLITAITPPVWIYVGLRVLLLIGDTVAYHLRRR